MASGSGNLATMGAAVPYAVGAKFCFPDRVCIAVTGDGAMQMNGLNACITVAKYWKEWSDPRWITLVLNNRDLNMVTWEQRIMMGDIKFDASQELPDFPYAASPNPSACAASASKSPSNSPMPGIARSPAIGPWFSKRSPIPTRRPLPPHITLQQAKNFTETILRGDPNEPGIVKQAIKGMVESLVPHSVRKMNRGHFRRDNVRSILGLQRHAVAGACAVGYAACHFWAQESRRTASDRFERDRGNIPRAEGLESAHPTCACNCGAQCADKRHLKRLAQCRRLLESRYSRRIAWHRPEGNRLRPAASMRWK